jgi:hypothetical protein
MQQLQEEYYIRLDRKTIYLVFFCLEDFDFSVIRKTFLISNNHQVVIVTLSGSVPTGPTTIGLPAFIDIGVAQVQGGTKEKSRPSGQTGFLLLKKIWDDSYSTY